MYNEFRAKTISKPSEESKWVYGDLVYQCTANPYIMDSKGNKHFIKLDTVGQFVGITLDDGTRVYEGDIVEIADIDYTFEGREEVGCYYGLIEFDSEFMSYRFNFDIIDDDYRVPYMECSSDRIKFIKGVIGNRYDDTKLLIKEAR